MSANLRRIFVFATALLVVCAVFDTKALAQTDETSTAGQTSSTAAIPVPSEQLANRCTATRKLAAKTPAWTGWGANPPNWRYQNAMQAGLFRRERAGTETQMGIWNS